MGEGGEVCVLQVSNVSPSATKDQVQTLFSYVGRIVEFHVSLFEHLQHMHNVI